MKCIDSVEKLRILNPKKFPCVTVAGYHYIADGGGGTFYWDDTFNVNLSLFPHGEDHGTIIKPNILPSSQPGRWRRISNEPISVRWFGAYGDDNHYDTPAIQFALNALQSNGGIIFFPSGTYKIKSTLKFGNNLVIQGAGPNSTIIKGDLNAAMIQSNDIAQRHNYIHMRDLQLENTGIHNVGSVGIDFTNVNLGEIRNVLIKNFETGILLSRLAYYNKLFNPMIFDASTGIKIINGANENHILGGKIQNVKLGIQLDGVSNTHIYGTCIEQFSLVGIDIGSTTVSSPKVIGTRIENTTHSGTGIRIDTSTQAAYIIGPYFQGLSKDIENFALDTNVIADKQWQICSNTEIREHSRVMVTLGQQVPYSIDSQSTVDYQILLNGVSEKDGVSITPPSNLPSGIIVIGIPASGIVYLRLANISKTLVDLVNSEFIVDIWKHNTI